MVSCLFGEGELAVCSVEEKLYKMYCQIVTYGRKKICLGQEEV